MIQATGINIKSTGATLQRKLDKKFRVGLLVVGLILALFFSWQYWSHLAHVRELAQASRRVSAVTAPAAGKPELAASAPKPDVQPAPAKTDDQIPAKAATASFADALLSVLSPSAKAESIQPEMPTAPSSETKTAQPAKRVAIQTAARASSGQEPAPMTAEQKRLKCAQDGFADALTLAYTFPDAYGFMPDENLGAARLGNPIPIYTLAQPGRMHYTGQPVQSLLTPADEWVFPVILENRIRFMVPVRGVGHDYVLGHGSRALAMVYEKILARWPASEGFHPQLVIQPNLPGYSFTIPELPGQNLTDTSRMFDFNPALSPATVMLASWR